MSTFVRGLSISKKGLKIALFVLLAVVLTGAITLGIVLSQKQDYIVAPENNNNLEMLNNASLLTVNGWNSEITTKLNNNLANIKDNSAAGDAGDSSVIGAVISLGGYEWQVVYKQNGIMTLYATEAVSTMNFGEDNEYSESAVREYLNNEFYNKFISNIGYANVSELFVPFGADEIYYQEYNAQNIPLKTVAGAEIADSYGAYGDLVWLPSAYEVGGFADLVNAPDKRVNSFRTLQENGFSINSGLWNLNNNSRLAVNGALLRSPIEDGIAVMNNGVVSKGYLGTKYEVRPCINMLIPSVNVVNSGVRQVSANESVNAVLTASVVPNFTQELQKYSTLSGNTFTINTTTGHPEKFLILLSDAVKAGQTFSGYTIKLACDVDMSDITTWSPVGSYALWDPIGRNGFAFQGTFDGQGHIISNLASANSGLVGLFGYVSGATIKNVAVTNSTWSTNGSNVGCIAGHATNSTIDQCYAEGTSITGVNYVGGICGYATSSAVISNCYNLGTVKATNGYAGGILGYGATATVNDSYSTGSVTGTYANVANNAATNNIVSGTAGASDMQGSKRLSNATGTVAITKPSKFSAWVFSDTGTWTVSNTLNSKMPILVVFLKNKTFTVNTMVSGSGGTITASSTSGIAYNASNLITITATPTWTTNSHYALSAWYRYSGNTVDTSQALNSFSITTNTTGAAYTVKVPATDNWNVAAVFEKMYSLNVSMVYNGFASGYSNANVTITNGTFGTAKWYKASETVSVNVPVNNIYVVNNLTGSATSNGTYSALTTGASNFVSLSGTTYTFDIAHATPYGSNDTYFVKVNLDRRYRVTLTTNQAGATSVSMTANSTTYDVNESAVVKYNATIAGDASAYANDNGQYKITGWTLNGTNVGTNSTCSCTPTGILGTPADSVYEINLTATLGNTTKTISVTETNGTYGYTVVTTTAKNDTQINEITADALSITVPYGGTYYIYIKPLYASGYELDTASGCTVNSNGTYDGTFTSNSTTSATTTHAVSFKQIIYTLNFVSQLDGGPASNQDFVLNKTSMTGTFGTSVANVVIATVNDYTKYFLSGVTTVYNGATVNTVTNSRPASGYVGTSSYNIFSTGTIGTLLGNNSTYNQKTLTVTLNFISITKTINVTQSMKYYENNTTTEKTKTENNLTVVITDKTTTSAVSGTTGVYQNLHNIAVTAPAGYEITKVAITVGSTTTNSNATSTGYGNSATADFTLSDNTSIVITYSKRHYIVTVTDNLVTLGLAYTNTYTYKLGQGSAATLGSGNYFNYGETFTLGGYTDVFTNASVKVARLDKIAINGANVADINSCSITLNGNTETIAIVLTYVKLNAVAVTVKKDDTATPEANALLVEFVNNETGDRMIEIVSANSSVLNFYCDTSETYTVKAFVPIFVTVNFTNGASGTGSYELTVNSDTSLAVELVLEASENSIYSSGSI